MKLMKIIQSVVITFLLVYMQQINAECGAISCDNVLITELYTEAYAGHGRLLVKLGGTVSNLNCTSVGGTHVTLSPTSLHFKPIYASLLAYQLVRRLVSVRIQEGSKQNILKPQKR